MRLTSFSRSKFQPRLSTKQETSLRQTKNMQMLKPCMRKWSQFAKNTRQRNHTRSPIRMKTFSSLCPRLCPKRVPNLLMQTINWQIYIDAERKFQDAEALYRKSEALRERAFGASSPQVAKSLNDLAAIYAQQGQYDQAEPLYKHVISILDISAYKEQPQMATALETYALVLKKTGREGEGK